MSAIAVEDREALAASVASLLRDRGGETAVRATMTTTAGYDPDLWRQLADMGVVGLAVPEQFGGAGAGAAELEAVMEEMGAALLCSPFLGSAVIATSLLVESGDADQKQRWLPALADGTALAAAALTGLDARWTEDSVSVSATESAGQWQLDGTAQYVLHAQNADVLIVAAADADGAALYIVDPAAAGVTIAALPEFDHTQRLARIEFAGADAARLAGSDWSTVERSVRVALVALAGDQAGGARRALENTVEYTKVRVQFGRPIGSFQAIKHMAADLLLESESATSAARYAAEALDAGDPDADTAVALAAFACADAFVTVASTSIQMHGGIGFTWEHPAHLYLRRARADAELLGSPSYHRERYLQQHILTKTEG